MTIYKQPILPLLDYAGFILISGNVSERNDLQTLQNDALRIYCVREPYYNVKYKNIPSNKGSLLRDSLPVEARRSGLLDEFEKAVSRLYSHYDPMEI